MKNQVKVTVWLSGQISVGRQPLAKARAKLVYDPSDPYAVHLAITSRHRPPIEWVFGRDLLMLGSTEPEGDGEVVVAPAPEPLSRKTLIALGRSGPCAVLVLKTRHLRNFLSDAYDVVPAGREEQHLNVDQLVTQLLAA